MPIVQQAVEDLLKKNEPHPLKVALHIFESLPSTNQKLWDLFAEGAAAGTVAIACEQTAGRGQWGRQWHSNNGGLYLSIGLTPNIPIANSAQLTMCSAWGIATALRKHDIPVLLKWPNDLILGDRKLGGILTETRVQHGLITKAVVGVGINWCNQVPEIGVNLQSFNQTITQPTVTSLEMLAAIAIEGILTGYQHLLDQGIEILLPSYLELLYNIGQEVSWEGHSGVIKGVTATGDLRVYLNSLTSSSEIYLKLGTINLGYQR